MNKRDQKDPGKVFFEHQRGRSNPTMVQVMNGNNFPMSCIGIDGPPEPSTK